MYKGALKCTGNPKIKIKTTFFHDSYHILCMLLYSAVYADSPKASLRRGGKPPWLCFPFLANVLLAALGTRGPGTISSVLRGALSRARGGSLSFERTSSGKALGGSLGRAVVASMSLNFCKANRKIISQEIPTPSCDSLR
jgi:hypothetical protein